MKEREDYHSNAERLMDKVTWKHKPYIFKWGDRLINVWVVTEFSHTYIQLQNGICYAQVMSVIRKKIAYQRNKDRAFLVNLAYPFPWNVWGKWQENVRCIHPRQVRFLMIIETTENRLTKTDVI